MQQKVKALIDTLHLTPLPAEGTLFVSTWRSNQECADGSPVGTAMVGMYCFYPPSQSLFHRLPVDEIWHFYGGDPLRLILLYSNGSSQDVVMGSDPLQGQQIQFVVPAGVWQAGHLMDGGTYALFGCTLAPGFTSSMYEGGQCDTLCAVYPDRVEDIIRLTSTEADLHMPEGFAN
jgi:predicted cupin superfamily sugar epimerase